MNESTVIGIDKLCLFDFTLNIKCRSDGFQSASLSNQLVNLAMIWYMNI